MDRAQFIQLWRQFAEGTFGFAVVEKPKASFILEKTPYHVHTAREILELFPEAYFVHIIRDPRAVVASMLDASRSWGKGWAPRTAVSAAEAWREAVLNGRHIKALTSRYTEVSYEGMLAGPESALARVLEMLGLGPDPEFCSQAAKTCAAPNMGKGTWKAWVPKSLESVKGIMVRKGQADGWRKELSRFQINAVEYVTRDLLSSFGYEPMIKPKLLTTVRLTTSGALAKFSHAVGRRLRGALKGV
jgi:hypothetical protein